MTRSEGRALAFELLYSLEIQKASLEEQQEQIELFLSNHEIKEEKVCFYIKETIKGISETKQEIENIISNNLKEKWNINRISKVNLVLLKLGIYEMLYVKLPCRVVVNESVELAKKYGDENSPSFINGILANVIKEQDLKVED